VITLYFTVIETAVEGMPLATVSSELAPVSAFDGTSKLVDMRAGIENMFG